MAFNSFIASGSVPLNFMNIEPLTGSNFKRWKADIEIYLNVNHLDLPMYKTPPEALTIASTSEQQKYFDEWHRLNRVCKNVMKRTMSDSVSGSIEEKELATEFLESIGERFKESDKAQIANLLNKLLNTKYTGSGTIREHILKLVDYAAKLKTLKNPISDEMLIHHTLNSLPTSFEHLNTTYLAQKDKWDINELISICVQVDERIKKEKNEKSVNLVGKPKWKNQKGNNQKGKKFSPTSSP
ncbi:uncharacterized protein LOC121049289 [Rosa chinensis]|uniref:uncharacterized protein LOC121049289 n=1 Tax=Rosa chinensis TaxID=74649 RepID=UPI001AD9017D|nr:uncharacterized protein LOC121049289 [Rosa chinensis]